MIIGTQRFSSKTKQREHFLLKSTTYFTFRADCHISLGPFDPNLLVHMSRTSLMATTNHQRNGSGQADPEKALTLHGNPIFLSRWENADPMFNATGMTVYMFVKFQHNKSVSKYHVVVNRRSYVDPWCDVNDVGIGSGLWLPTKNNCHPCVHNVLKMVSFHSELSRWGITGQFDCLHTAVDFEKNQFVPTKMESFIVVLSVQNYV